MSEHLKEKAPDLVKHIGEEVLKLDLKKVKVAEAPKPEKTADNVSFVYAYLKTGNQVGDVELAQKAGLTPEIVKDLRKQFNDAIGEVNKVEE